MSQIALRAETVILGMGLLLAGVAAGLAEESATTALQAGMLAAAAISAVLGIVQYLAASEAFEGARIDPHASRAWAETFDTRNFQARFHGLVERAWAAWVRDPGSVKGAVLAAG